MNIVGKGVLPNKGKKLLTKSAITWGFIVGFIFAQASYASKASEMVKVGIPMTPQPPNNKQESNQVSKTQGIGDVACGIYEIRGKISSPGVGQFILTMFEGSQGSRDFQLLGGNTEQLKRLIGKERSFEIFIPEAVRKGGNAIGIFKSAPEPQGSGKVLFSLIEKQACLSELEIQKLLSGPQK